MSAVLQTRTISEMRGFMKALVDANSDRLIGFTLLGQEAREAEHRAGGDVGRRAIY